MNRFLLLCGIAIGISAQLFAQPAEYNSRGVRSYLVNYGAVNGDRFLAEFAARRFQLIDESGKADIPMIHAENPDMPILRYKDMVAVYPSSAEYHTVNADEWAFIHSCEPSGMVIRRDNDTAHIYWLPDGRDSIAGYWVYGMSDSLGSPAMIVDTMIQECSVRTEIPDGCTWLMIASQTVEGAQRNYGMPVRIPDISQSELCMIPYKISESRDADTVYLEYRIRDIGSIHPDTVYILVDLDRNNTLTKSVERFPMRYADGLWQFDTTISISGVRTNCGYECQVEIVHNGISVFLPEQGKWHTNLNNRTKNNTYGFYVMDVRNSTWRQAYIAQLYAAFQSLGYTGVFEDDCWYRIANYGVDAYPPYAYDDATWLVGLYAMMDSIKTAMQTRPVYFNGLSSVTSDSLLLHADGGMTEGFACTHWSGLVSGSSWGNQCNRGLSAQHQYHKSWLALGGAYHDQPSDRLYVLASYLLVADSLALFGNASSYQEFAHYPEFDLPLGAPLQSATLDIEELGVTIGTERLYIREFENATVVVNPSTVPVIYDGVQGRSSIYVDGGITTEGGRVGTEKTVNLLHPATARIYLKGGQDVVLESPVIDSITVSPSPVPADGVTQCTVSVLAHDSSDALFRSDSSLPLYIILDAGVVGGPRKLVLLPETTGSPELPVWFTGVFTIPVGAPPDTAVLPVTVYSATGVVTVGWCTLQIEGGDKENLVMNYSFEIDNNEDGTPDYWRSYVKGFQYETSGTEYVTGSRCIYMRNDSASDYRGVYTTVTVNQTTAEPLYLSGWSKCQDADGARNSDYSIYADVRYTDGTPLYGQTATFETGTHDWEFSEKVIYPAQPVKSVSLYVLFRRHTGKAWFDQITLKPFDPSPVQNVPLPDHTLMVYPNPSSGMITVQYRTDFDEGSTIRIVDILGREVYAMKDNSLSYGNALQIQTQRFPEGIYYIQLIHPDGCQTIPLIIAR